MGQAIPTQHPAVVLRSHYNHLRALLVVATIAVVGLATAVVILANDEDRAPSVSTATPVVVQPNSGERYDGGPRKAPATSRPRPPRSPVTTAGPRKAPATSRPRPRSPVTTADPRKAPATSRPRAPRSPVTTADPRRELRLALRTQPPIPPRLSGHPLRRRPRGGHHRSGSLTQPGRSTCVPRRSPRRGTWCVRGSSRRVRTRDHGSDEGGTATPSDANALAAIFLESRRAAMPWLPELL